MNTKENLNNHSITPNEEELMWQNISSKIRQQQHSNVNKYYRIAAILLILITIGGIFSYNRFISPDTYIAKSHDLKVSLKDGSTIILLKGARLTVEKSFPQKTRNVFLNGNAIFTISKSKEHPFIVHTENYDTKVLGTIFKIVQNNKEFKVELYEGKVAVQKKNTTETIYLTPNNTFDNFGSTSVSTVTKTKEKTPTSIINKKIENNQLKSVNLSFNECKVSDAIKVIEKSYNISIVYPEDYKDKNISLAIENASKETILQSLAVYLNLKIKGNNANYQFEK